MQPLTEPTPNETTETLNPTYPIGWKKYINPTHKYLKKYMEYYGESIYTDIIETIHTAHQSNESECLLFQFVDSTILCTATKDEFIPILNSILQWYIAKENYKKCSYIQSIIIKLNNKKVIKKVTV
jgi:hypothetical protein